jgi:hypothetical protein
MAGDKICCASYVENGENMMDKDELNVSSDPEDEIKENSEFLIYPEFEFSVRYIVFYQCHTFIIYLYLRNCLICWEK